jgi:flagellar biosynthesis protein FlhB
MENNSNTKGKSIASLVLGIASVALPWFGFTSIVSIIAGIVGIILSVPVRKLNDENKNMATAGLVLSIIGIVLSGIMLVCVICSVCVIASAGSAASLASYY